MPDTQRTIEDQAARNRRGQQLLDRRRAITGDAYRKLLLLILDDHIGPKASYPLTFAHLAEETEMHETTVRRKAAELKDQGLIDYEETAPGSSLYEFRIIRSNVQEAAELAKRQSPLPRRKRGRPRKDDVQAAKNKCTPQKHFAACKNDLPTAKSFCTVHSAPYIERPLNDIPTNPITHARGADARHSSPPASDEPPPGIDGDGVKRNGSGGWDSPIEASQLTKADCVQLRYLEAVRKGWIAPTEQNQINFFALSRYCGKAPGVRKRPQAFTFYLKRLKWEVIRCEDLDAATKAVRSFRGPPGHAAAAFGLNALSTGQDIFEEVK